MNTTDAIKIVTIPHSVDVTAYIRNSSDFFGGSPVVLIIPHGFQNNLLNQSTRARLNVTYTTTTFFLNNFGANISAVQRQGIQAGLSALNSAIVNLPQFNTSLTFVSSPGDQGAQVVEGIISSVANSFNYKLIGSTPLISFSDVPYSYRAVRPVDYYVPGLIAAFMMTNGVIGVTNIASEFKRRGLIKRLSATPLSRFEWIVGNVLSQAVLALLLTAVMILLGEALYHVTVVISIYTVGIVVLGAILFSGIGMLLAGLVKDPEAAAGVGNAIAFPMMFLSGTYWPISIMPQFLQSFSRVLPLTYFAEGLRDAMILENNGAALANMGVLALLAIAFIAVGARATSWKEK